MLTQHPAHGRFPGALLVDVEGPALAAAQDVGPVVQQAQAQQLIIRVPILACEALHISTGWQKLSVGSTAPAKSALHVRFRETAAQAPHTVLQRLELQASLTCMQAPCGF